MSDFKDYTQLTSLKETVYIEKIWRIVKWSWKNKKRVHNDDSVVELSLLTPIRKESSLWTTPIVTQSTRNINI